jgi:hypothetical protein
MTQSSGESGTPDLPLLRPTVPAVATGLVARLLGAATALLAAATARTRPKFEPLRVLMPALIREALASLPPLHNPDRLVRQHLVAPAKQVHLVEHYGLNVRHAVRHVQHLKWIQEMHRLADLQPHDEAQQGPPELTQLP